MSPARPPIDGAVPPGQLLQELEQRQNEALAQLEALDSRVESVLAGFGIRPVAVEPVVDGGAEG